MLKKTKVAFTVGEVDRSGRVFTREALEQAVESYQEDIKHGGHGYLVSDVGDQLLSLQNVTHYVESLYFEGDEVKADITILDTHKGHILQEMIENGNGFCLSYVCSIPGGEEDLENMRIKNLNIELDTQTRG